MARRLPQLTALRAFDAAARHLSFTRAAEELGITQAAVSWQMRQLEGQVGQKLFRRLTRQLELTPAGTELAEAVADAFERIGATLARLEARTGGGVLAVTTVHTFASQWLLPRLGHFQLRRPDIAVRVEASVEFRDLEAEFDVAFRSGRGDWPGLVAEKLVDFALTPALSPVLAARIGGVAQPSDLLRLPLLDSQHPEDVRWWRDWFAQAGVANPTVTFGVQYDTHALTGTAAAMGQGVGLICPSLFAGELAAGRLVLPFPDMVLRTELSYWLAYSRRRAQEPKIVAFRDWVLSEVAACRDGCGRAA